jgi:chromate reductase
MSAPPYRILTICGSLRRNSRNRAILAAAIELAPPSLAFEAFELHDIPLYNGDVEQEGFPAPVAALRDAIRAADGLLIVTPEYNHSIPGLLKNALDWASRPPEMPFRGKPAGVMGGSNGFIGTARCQAHLRQVLFTLGVRQMVHGEVLVSRAQDKINAEGRLADDKTREVIGRYMADFAQWVGG